MSGSANPFDAFDSEAPNPFDTFDAPAAPAARPSLGERFRTNAESGYRESALGAVDTATSPFVRPAQAVLDDVRAIGNLFMPGTFQGRETPEARAARQDAEWRQFHQREQDMPSWSSAPSLADKVMEGGAALAGQVAGGAMSPENLVGPLGGGVRRVGQGILSHLGELFLRGAALQAPAAGVANAGVQALQVADGRKEEFSPEEVALAAGLGGALGGGLNVAPAVARAAIGRIREWRTARGLPPEQVNAPVAPEEALATWTSDDVRAVAEASGITDPADPFVARIEERLGMRRAAEADPLVAAQQRADNVTVPKTGPQTPAQRVASLLPGVEDQVGSEAASGMRFNNPDGTINQAAIEAEVQRRLRSILPGMEPREAPPPVIALPGENGRVRGQIIEPGAENSPREVTVPVRGTGEPGVQAGAELRTGQGTALVPTERPVTDPAPRPMDDGQVARAAAQNEGGTSQLDARRSRVVQEVDADIAAGRVARAQRRQEIQARMAAADTPVMREVPPALLGGERLPAANERPTPPQTYAGQNRADIARREASRPSGNDRPPAPPAPPTADAPNLTPWQAAADKARKRAGELRAEIARMEEGAAALQRGDKSHPAYAEAERYKRPDTRKRAIGAKMAQADALEGRAVALDRAMADMREGRQPPMRLEYPNPEDNKPAVPGEPRPPASVVARIKELGGMRDDRGDFVRYRIPGLVDNKSRLSFEDMADTLASEGFFPELRAEANGDSVRQLNPKDLLLNAIEETQAGRPQYAPDAKANYDAEVAARDVALEQVQDVARHLGIEPAQARGLTRGQIADLGADARSFEETAALVRELDDAHARDLADFEARANDPDNVNPDVPPTDLERSRSRPVTQEDIERVPPPDQDPDVPRPSGEREDGGRGAARSEGEPGAQGRSQEAQGQLDRPADRADGGGTEAPGRTSEPDRGAGDGAPRERAPEGRASGDLIPNDNPATQAQKAREAQGGGRIRSEAKQKGVEDFELFDPDARKQQGLDLGGAAERTASEVNRLDKLYGGFPLADPEAWKFLFGPVNKHIIKPWAEALHEANTAFGATKAAARAEDAKLAGPTGQPRSPMTAPLRAAGAFIRAATYSDGVAMRSMADGLPPGAKEALHDFLDRWHANAGRAGSGKGATYSEGVEMHFNSSINGLNDALGSLAKSPEAMAQVAKLVQNPGQIRPGSKIHDAAAKVRDWLKAELDYMRGQGVDVGEIKRGYFPRRLDTDKVWSDQEGFMAAARKAYRSSGMNPDEADASAKAWLDAIKHGGADATSPISHKGAPGLAPDHVTERVLPKAADEILGKFLMTDPLQTLVGYAHTAARRAELSRVMGPEFEAWKKLADDFRKAGAEPALGRVADFVRTQTGHTTGSWNNPQLQRAAGWVRLWGTMGLLSKATITSLSEVFNAGARGGRVLDSWDQVRHMTAYWMGKESGERLKLLAEDVGTMTNHLAGSMAAARWTGGRPSSASQAFVAERYFRAIGLEQWTHGMNVGATGVGDTFIRRMANDLGAEGRYGRQASFALAELGIPREKHEAFAKWVKTAGKDGMTVEALAKAPKDIADAYRAALFRFTSQVSMRPGAISRPRWANSPLGSLAFHLSAYAYAVHDNVLLRAKRVFQNGDLTTGDKLMLAGKMAASLALAIPAQLALGEARSAIFDSEKTKKAYGENRMDLAVSRAGLLGAVDPWWQIISGLKYRKELSTSMLGPTLGKVAGIAQIAADQAQSSLNPFGPPKNRTATDKRKLATALYDLGLNAPANFVAARVGAPLPIAAAIALATGSSRVREAFVSAVGAPPPKDNRRRR